MVSYCYRRDYFPTADTVYCEWDVCATGRSSIFSVVFQLLDWSKYTREHTIQNSSATDVQRLDNDVGPSEIRTMYWPQIHDGWRDQRRVVRTFQLGEKSALTLSTRTCVEWSLSFVKTTRLKINIRTTIRYFVIRKCEWRCIPYMHVRQECNPITIQALRPANDTQY